ncbi:MAG: hypothetical protein VB142_04855 [Burkholderia sp.]
MVSIIFEVMDTILLDTEKPGSRKGRSNHSPEFRCRIAIAAVSQVFQPPNWPASIV